MLLFGIGSIPIVGLIKKESEGVLMIILYDFGFIEMIVFHLISFLIVSAKSRKSVYEGWKFTSGFSYLAVPTRHPA